jgi:hypothetical protein
MPPPPPTTPLTIVTKAPMPGSFISPRAEVDGFPVALSWGSNVLGLTHGVHNITVYMPWLWKFGHAQITVDTTQGPPQTVYYAGPWVNFGAGAIGFSPVKNPNLAAFIAIFAVPLALIAICCGVAALM